MTDPELKVNDKRMFTPDGELREEFSHLEDSPAPDVAARAREAPPAQEARPPEPKEPLAGSTQPGPGQAGNGEAGSAGLPDLVGLLAQHAALYLGDAALPDGRSMLDLEAAQMHIDLLEVLREKTEGNRTQEETAFLDDVLYRLRLAYVDKRRQEE